MNRARSGAESRPNARDSAFVPPNIGASSYRSCAASAGHRRSISKVSGRTNLVRRWRIRPHNYIEPCDPGDPGGRRGSWRFSTDFQSPDGDGFLGLLCRHSHRAKPRAASPATPPFTSRIVFGRAGSGTSNSRYTAVSGRGSGSAGRGFRRRSGTGTHRAMYANVSDAHAGHCCASWISSQSRQRRADRRCTLGQCNAVNLQSTIW
jgi:hypothetical protein